MYFADVVTHSDRAAQRDLLGRVAADDGIVHVEVRPPGVRPQQHVVLDALRRELGLELAVRQRLLDELGRKALEEVELAVGERQPRRLPLLDDRYLDAPRKRQLPALERRRDRLRCRRHRPRGHVRRVAVAGVRHQHDLRAALVLAEHVRSGPDRVRTDVETVGIDDLAGDGRRVRHGEHVEEAEVRLREADAQRVAVDDLEAGDRGLVVELPGSEGPLAHGVGTDDLAVDQPQPRALDGGIEQPPDRIRLIGGGQLARLAVERGIRREEDALPQPEREGRTAVGHLRHRFERTRHQLHRSRQVVVGQHRVEDVVDHAVRRGVGGELRIEARLGDRKRDAQRLRRIGGEGRRDEWMQRDERRDERRLDRPPHAIRWSRHAHRSGLQEPAWHPTSTIIEPTTGGRATSP